MHRSSCESTALHQKLCIEKNHSNKQWPILILQNSFSIGGCKYPSSLQSKEANLHYAVPHLGKS